MLAGRGYVAMFSSQRYTYPACKNRSNVASRIHSDQLWIVASRELCSSLKRAFKLVNAQVALMIIESCMPVMADSDTRGKQECTLVNLCKLLGTHIPSPIVCDVRKAL